MVTVPAQRFSAPALAALIAAARFIPGVCGVFTSSSSACTTRTPLSRQSDPVSLSVIAGLPAPRDDCPGAMELVLKRALRVLNAMMLHDGGAGRWPRKPLRFRCRDRKDYALRRDLGHFWSVHK